MVPHLLHVKLPWERLACPLSGDKPKGLTSNPYDPHKKIQACPHMPVTPALGDKYEQTSQARWATSLVETT